MDAPPERRSHWFADLAWLGEVAERVTRSALPMAASLG